MNALLSAYRFYFKALFAIAPKAASRKAMQVFGTPIHKKVRHREIEILAKAKQETMVVQGSVLQLYKWGHGKKKALLVHGWEGNAGSLAGMVELLLKQDYTVWSFDGPAHGKSQGKTTNLFQFAGIVAELLKQKEIRDSILAHSFGSAATVQALASHPELQVKKVALLSTPDRLLDVIREYARVMDFGPKNTATFIAYLNQFFATDASQINVSTQIVRAHADAFLIAHDEEDKILPYTNSARVAAAVPDKAELLTLHQTGHYKMLWSKALMEAVDQFLKETVAV